MRARSTRCLLLALVLVTGVAAAAEVQVDGGLIRGDVEMDGTRVFLGVPYAAPPLGELRWRPPQPVVPWQGVRDATSYRDSCAQLPPAPSPRKIYGSTRARGMSEDCLYLNVWTPAMDPETPLPVMFWIHGGGNTSGSSASTMFDGRMLAQQGVVVVTVNYRLNLFGFFAHPALSAESEQGVSGNYGLLDQIAALHWVQRNIGRFGGDPGRVTIFGESAGGTDVVCLLVSPLSTGLFAGAIAQSPWDTSLGHHLRRSWYGYDPGERSADPWLEELGVGDVADPIAALRTRPAEDLLQAWRKVTGTVRFGHLVDGWVIPDDIGVLLESGRQHRVPLMAGITANEGSIFLRGGAPTTVVALRAILDKEYGTDAGAVLDVLGVGGDADVPAAAAQGISDTWFGVACRYTARAVTAQGQRAFLYRFSRVRPDPFCREQILAFHGSELPYIFHTLEGVELEYDQRDVELSRVVSAYWVRFATTGNPNGPGLPVWPAYSPGSDRYLDIGDDVVARSGLRMRAYDLLDGIYARRRASRALQD